MTRALWLSLGGLAQALSLAWPWGGASLPALQIISMVVLCWQLITCQRPQQGFWLSWCFATAWLVGTFWWLFISLHTYGGMPSFLAAFAVLLLAAALGLYYAGAGALAVFLCNKGKGSGATHIVVFASAWTLAELARAELFTGFPWGAIGYAHIDGALSGLAPWLGLYGVGWLAAAIAMFCALGLKKLSRTESEAHSKSNWTGPGFGLACLVGVQLPAYQHLTNAQPTVPALQVTVLQGNIAQSEKFQPSTGIAQALRWYQSELLKVTDGLVIAPETALPLLPMHLPAGYLDSLRHHFQNGQAAALIGIPWKESKNLERPEYSNTALGWRPGMDADYRYDKSHLVPFGEFVPPLFRWFTNLMNMPLGEFKSGGMYQGTLDWQGQRIAPNICYEDLFGEELARSFVDPGKAPTVMVNISNIAWFGNTIAIDQHLNIARMRTLELQRPMVRATNTGMTAVINHQGQVTAQLPRHSAGVLVATVQGRDDPPSLFAQWASRWGLRPIWAVCTVVILAAWWLRRKNQASAS